MKKFSPQPSTFSCVLTEQNGARVYVTYLRYYKKLSDEDVKKLNETNPELDLSQKLFFPKILCMTSHWPFYELHEDFLLFGVYDHVIKSKKTSNTVGTSFN
eukprot:UN28135